MYYTASLAECRTRNEAGVQRPNEAMLLLDQLVDYIPECYDAVDFAIFAKHNLPVRISGTWIARCVPRFLSLIQFSNYWCKWSVKQRPRFPDNFNFWSCRIRSSPRPTSIPLAELDVNSIGVVLVQRQHCNPLSPRKAW